MKVIHVSGKRKRAIARATIKPGKGTVRINRMLLDNIQPRLSRMRIREPILLAGDIVKKMSISVSVIGGGITSQADAARLAIARAIVQFSNDKKLETTYLDYDRQLLVADVRRKEVSKPNRHGKARAKRQKSYR
ncbi:MAG: 30S ribosomal protein S9 [archaeon]